MAFPIGSWQSTTSSAVPEDEYANESLIFQKQHYDKIPVSSRGAIRILKVYPGSPEQDDVLCELIPGTILDYEECQQHVPPLEFKPYDALSWCWGKAPQDGRISIRMGETSYVKFIQPSLVAALRAFRHKTHDRHIWVDAICINQDYKPEKNHQVEMMAEIYGRADCVRIWLGDPDASSKLAILFIKQQVLQLQHFDDLCRSTEFTGEWKALLELMQREWFSRRWVVQEVALAPKAMIHCGAAKLSWNKFAVAVELFVEVETATHRLSEVMKTDTKYNHVPRWFEYISQLGASLLVDATGKLFRDYDYIRRLQPQPKQRKHQPKVNSVKQPDDLAYDSEDDEVVAPEVRAKRYKEEVEERHTQNRQNLEAMTKAQPLLTLEYLVSNLSIFDVTNPHDSVYALLGISKDTTPTAAKKKLRVTDHTQAVLEMFTAKKQYKVDYEASYIDICKEFIEFCVRRNASRDPSRALDVICRPFAVDIEQKPDELPFPSWIPRLSKASYGMDRGPGIDGLRMGRKNADSLVGLPNLTHRNYNAAETKSLDKKVFRFRKRVSPKDDGKAASDGKSGQKTASPMQSSQPNLNHFSLFVKGFILDTIVEVQPSSQSGSIPTAWTHFAGWSETRNTPPEHFWRTLVADRGSDGKNPPVYYSRACQESFRKGNTTSGVVDTTGLIEHERNSVVAQFCRRVQAAIWNRALVKTKAGRLGLVAANVKELDCVCILYGCSVPVVLRRHGPKEMHVIKSEMKWELKFLANYVGESYKNHLNRRKLFREKRELDKKTYKAWEGKKREEWRNDAIWTEQWKLVRAGLMRIHEFRAWVIKKKVTELEHAEECEVAKKATETMRSYVHVLLPQIYEIATWVSKGRDNGKNIMDQLGSSNDDATLRESFKLTEDQKALWDLFCKDTEWKNWWTKLNDDYRNNEGFYMWARIHKKPFVYPDDLAKTRKEWEKESGQAWTTEWATTNSMVLCIDSFRAWIRERGKFYGSEEFLNNKQKWEIDSGWHKEWVKDESEVESFNAWMNKKGLENPDLQESTTKEHRSIFEEWRKTWLLDNPEATGPECWKAEKEEWEEIGKKLEHQKNEENDKRKMKAQKRDKEPFLERWRRDWKPEVVNWKEFEMALSYGRHWLKLVKRRKRDYVKEQEQEWSELEAIKSRQLQRAENLKKKKRDRVILYPIEATKTTAVNETDTKVTPTHDLPKNPNISTNKINGNNQANGDGIGRNLSQKSRTVDASTIVNHADDAPSQPNDSTAQAALLSSKHWKNSAQHRNHYQEASHTPLMPPLERSRTLMEHIVRLHAELQEEAEDPFTSQKVLQEWIQRKKGELPALWEATQSNIKKHLTIWDQDTTKTIGRDGKFHHDFRPASKSEKMLGEKQRLERIFLSRRERDTKRKTNEEADKGKAEEMAKEKISGENKELSQEIDKSGTEEKFYGGIKRRQRLKEKEKDDYEKIIEANFLAKLGEDGKWYYEMMGECYVHGMMDGEAMAYQNNEGIPSTVLEIR